MDQGKSCVSNFDYWQEGYGAFTHSAGDKQSLMQYIATNRNTTSAFLSG